ncbi:MAG: lecithin retinol acyltransferase family protein [Megasphaera massiliensis]|jgi:hypothetical protein|uniref:lecithin retinol acyltransferase family protein n=1 Tax=Megasphaera TaxID=906 RepID=UPI00258DCE38|nr:MULTISPECIES: lecithin retinol acyltransferase family protein [Megasphaera]MDY2964684.1 lecithin retinol acyltransferase family protein [Megasphaera massiliensis]
MSEMPDYGAIIYVVRAFLCFGSYHHYGVYTGNGKVVHFAPAVRNGIKEKCIHETTMNKFLAGANDYSVRYFPSSTAVLEMLVRKKAGNITLADSLWQDLESQKCHIYTPEETVQRAYACARNQTLGGYSLTSNNCEHFAIYCKTNLLYSDQVGKLFNWVFI